MSRLKLTYLTCIYILFSLVTSGCQLTLLEAPTGSLTSSLISATAPVVLPQVPASPPVRLKIPSLDIDAAIESVGLDASGAMDVPTYVEDVGWYNRGTTPGEIGKAVMAGHLDAIGGAPAVFYRIGELQVGDSIVVVHEDNTESHFEVTHQAVYPYAETPFDKVFGFSLQSELNLITCTGSWNRGAQNYTNRLVVFTQKVK